ncbi:MAG: hypothetical protein VB029_02740 [Anaerolineaceae bacterium]|nr:hypothetical protein [Anaerolineaceae bacterium]HNX46321.1 hypothetical protein [Anaerolineaceae bacterium]
MIIKLVLLAFVALETSNVIALYFFPGSRMANAVGVFTAWEQSKQYPEIHDFVRYLVYWVAGVKLIFLLLLGLIVAFGDLNLQRLSLVALALATLSFFWRLFPLARRMDGEGRMQPRKYSLVLAGMILALIALFVIAAFLGGQ